MFWPYALLVLLAQLHLSTAKVLTQRLSPGVSARTQFLRERAAGLDHDANITIQYEKKAFEWYLVDITIGTPREFLVIAERRGTL